jgi:hypothetical protein
VKTPPTRTDSLLSLFIPVSTPLYFLLVLSLPSPEPTTEPLLPTVNNGPPPHTALLRLYLTSLYSLRSKRLMVIYKLLWDNHPIRRWQV